MATITKGKTFTSGETVTPAKLNDLVDNATVTAIQTADIADGQITNAKVSDSAAIAYSKLNLANSIVAGDIASDAVTTAKILNANVTPAKLSQPYTLATAQNSTSGTSIDFTGIPSWVRRITVMFNGVSTSGTSSIQIQLGTGAGPTFTTSGYLGACGGISNGSLPAVEQNGAGFRVVANINNTEIFHGNITVSNLTANTWAQLGILGQSTTRINWSGGSVALAAQLTAVRITTVNGTETFDAGSINIAYEG